MGDELLDAQLAFDHEVEAELDVAARGPLDEDGGVVGAVLPVVVEEARACAGGAAQVDVAGVGGEGGVDAAAAGHDDAAHLVGVGRQLHHLEQRLEGVGAVAAEADHGRVEAIAPSEGLHSLHGVFLGHVRHGIGAELAGEVEPHGDAVEADDSGARQACELGGHLADDAEADDGHELAELRLHASDRVEGGGGQVVEGRLLEARGVGDGEGEVLGAVAQGGVWRVVDDAHARQALAGRECLAAVAGFEDDACIRVAEAARRRVRRVQPPALHPAHLGAGADEGGVHLDEDLARPVGGHGLFFDGQHATSVDGEEPARHR